MLVVGLMYLSEKAGPLNLRLRTQGNCSGMSSQTITSAAGEMGNKGIRTPACTFVWKGGVAGHALRKRGS